MEKKILYIFSSLEYSGAELMYIQAAPFLLNRGYEIHAVATAMNMGACTDLFLNAGFRLHHCPLRNWKSFVEVYRFIRTLSGLVQKESITHMHCQVNGLFFICAYVAYKNGIKSIYSVNNMFDCRNFMFPYHKLQRVISKKIFNMRFHSGSDTVYQHEKQYWKNDTEIVYWWYNEKDYYPVTLKEKEKTRNELNISNNSFVLMTAGCCSSIKRHGDIIRAVPQIVKVIPNFLFLHLGEGLLENEEKLLAKELGVDNYIRFCGNQTDFRKYLSVADVYTMTSTREGLSNATIDALACGIPAVLYHVTGLWDYNIDGDNTLQIKEDPSELALAVIKLYNDISLRNTYICRGKQLVCSKYQAGANINRLINVFYQ